MLFTGGSLDPFGIVLIDYSHRPNEQRGMDKGLSQ